MKYRYEIIGALMVEGREDLAQIVAGIAEQHQVKIALKTLKMSRMGANIAGGMNHVGAIKVLRINGYSDKKIADLLRAAGHPHTDIQNWFREVILGSKVQADLLSPAMVRSVTSLLISYLNNRIHLQELTKKLLVMTQGNSELMSAIQLKTALLAENLKNLFKYDPASLR